MHIPTLTDNLTNDMTYLANIAAIKLEAWKIYKMLKLYKRKLKLWVILLLRFWIYHIWRERLPVFTGKALNNPEYFQEETKIKNVRN